MIHATAVVDSRAQLGPNVAVGPYAVIDGDVQIGEGSSIGPHVHLTGQGYLKMGDMFYEDLMKAYAAKAKQPFNKAVKQ